MSPQESSTLSGEEVRILSDKNNLQARKNFLHFRETMDGLNLDYLWLRRNEILPRISMHDALQVQIGEAYLKKEQINYFLRAVMYATTQDTLYTQATPYKVTLSNIRRDNAQD